MPSQPPATSPARRRSGPRRDFALATFAFLASILVNWGSVPLFDPDEARYVEVTREMLETGQWGIPQLNYETRIKKPAPYHWILAAAMKLRGETAAAARTPSLLAALAVLLLVVRMARRYGPSPSGGLVAFAILSSTLLFWGMARIAMVDMLLCLTTTAAMALLFEWEQDRIRRGGLLWLAALAVAAGVNLKGPVALAVPAVVFALYALLRGQVRVRRGEKGAPWGRLLLCTTALSLPWYLWVCWRLGRKAIVYFFVDETVMRYFSSDFNRSENILFYLLVGPTAFLIWTPLVVVGTWGCLSEMRREGIRAWSGRQPYRAFLLAWLVGVFGFFSLAGSKLPHYVLPAMPAGALLAAEWWERRRGGETRLWRWPAAVCAVAAAAAWMFLSDPTDRTRSVAPELSVLAGALLLLSLSTLVPLWARGPRFVLAASICALFISSHAVRVASRDEKKYPSEHAFADMVHHWAIPPTRIYSVEQIRPSLLFYVAHKIEKSDTPEEAHPVLAATEPAILVGSPRNFAKLRQQLVEAGYAADGEFRTIPFGPRMLAPNAAYEAHYLSATPVVVPERGKLRLLVLGDTGTGYPGQYRLARAAASLAPAPDAVLLLGDNIYPDCAAGDARLDAVFTEPYAPLIAAGIPFYAALGNHDTPTLKPQIHDPLWHMGGRRYYSQTFADGLVEIFFLDSTAMKRFQPLPSWNGDRAQAKWFKGALAASKAPWKIVALHHPIYQVATDHKGSGRIRTTLEPVMHEAGVAYLLCGHSHIYSRLQRPAAAGGLLQIVVGNSGHLNKGHGLHLPGVVKLFDQDLAFLVLDIDPEETRFHAVAVTGETVDQGSIPLPRPGPPRRAGRAAVR